MRFMCEDAGGFSRGYGVLWTTVLGRGFTVVRAASEDLEAVVYVRAVRYDVPQ